MPIVHDIHVVICPPPPSYACAAHFCIAFCACGVFIVKNSVTVVTTVFMVVNGTHL